MAAAARARKREDDDNLVKQDPVGTNSGVDAIGVDWQIAGGWHPFTGRQGRPGNASKGPLT